MVRTSNTGRLGSSPATTARMARATEDGSDAVSTTIVVLAAVAMGFRPTGSFTDWDVPWGAVKRIDTKWALELTLERGRFVEVYDEATKERYVPHVIEPAAGVGRATLAFLVDAYDEEHVEGSADDVRTVLRLHPRLAPIKVAIFPLVKKDGQPELAQEIRESLRNVGQTEYDESGAIGKRYRRQDEIGTPWCVTVDHQSLEDRTVTVRDRDSLAQERVAIDDLPALFAGKLASPWTSPKVAQG